MQWIMRSLLVALAGTLTANADEQTFRLAKELLSESEYDLSAVEFRRFAYETDKEPAQAASYLFASYAYLRSDNGASASEMLDRSENADAANQFLNERTLLSAESARLRHDVDTALYFYDVLATENDKVDFQTFARQRAAAVHLGRGNVDAARRELEQSPSDERAALEALETFAEGSDKSPAIGGLLGLIPGAGYWYSGEVANGFRSLILNSLFMFGMYHTAEEEQWGAFAVITFFEITWYSGSVYGGIDAAQRYNRDRLDTALRGIEGDLSFRPDPEVVVPVFKLNIHF
jgi:hypothetical protein